MAYIPNPEGRTLDGDITKCRMRPAIAGIICMEPEEACERCGWNPAEEARRKAQLKRNLRKDG